MRVATDVQYSYQVLGDLRLGLPGKEQGGTLPERQRSWYELALPFIRRTSPKMHLLLLESCSGWLLMNGPQLLMRFCAVFGRGRIYFQHDRP